MQSEIITSQTAVSMYELENYRSATELKDYVLRRLKDEHGHTLLEKLIEKGGPTVVEMKLEEFPEIDRMIYRMSSRLTSVINHEIHAPVYKKVEVLEPVFIYSIHPVKKIVQRFGEWLCKTFSDK